MDRRRRPDHQTACTSIERLSLRVHPAKICQPRNSEKSIPSQQELDLERRVPSSGNVGIAWPAGIYCIIMHDECAPHGARRDTLVRPQEIAGDGEWRCCSKHAGE